ncbi:hypothetical protein [Luteolibacter luteus]|uniref:Uncharacterized protein n=1 Tax=Luteolibacter luteus TaxID=2728835 RepID=A0A858RLS5_9BACT|nr:hypothetical protein [Luteolibacter luteus]QJE96943.1 hypothetical protein HHL09_14485 [Luteolibacter luteus]
MPLPKTSASRTQRVIALAAATAVAVVLTAVVYHRNSSTPPSPDIQDSAKKPSSRPTDTDLSAKISAMKARLEATMSSLQETTLELEAARRKALEANPELAKAYETSKLYGELATASSYESSEVATWWHQQHIDDTWKPEMLSARNKILLQEWQASLDDPQSKGWLESMLADERFLNKVEVLSHGKIWSDPQAAIPEIPPPEILNQALAGGPESLQLTAAESQSLPERIQEIMREQAEICVLGEASTRFYQNNQGPEVAALETKRAKLAEIAQNIHRELGDYQRTTQKQDK